MSRATRNFSRTLRRRSSSPTPAWNDDKAIAQLRKAIELKKLRTGAEVKKEFVQILTRILKVQDTMLLLTTQPSVVLVVASTASARRRRSCKLAPAQERRQPFCSPAADTFRAAAADQLTVWAQRAGVDIVKHEGARIPPPWCLTPFRRRRPAARTSSSSTPPAACTTKANLMNELNKITRVIRPRAAGGRYRKRSAVLRCHDRPERPHQAKQFSTR